jgi:hypothetical protein
LVTFFGGAKKVTSRRAAPGDVDFEFRTCGAMRFAYRDAPRIARYSRLNPMPNNRAINPKTVAKAKIKDNRRNLDTQSFGTSSNVNILTTSLID